MYNTKEHNENLLAAINAMYDYDYNKHSIWGYWKRMFTRWYTIQGNIKVGDQVWLPEHDGGVLGILVDTDGKLYKVLTPECRVIYVLRHQMELDTRPKVRDYNKSVKLQNN